MIKEAKAIAPDLKNISISLLVSADSFTGSDSISIVYIQFNKLPTSNEKTKLQNRMETKLNRKII